MLPPKFALFFYLTTGLTDGMFAIIRTLFFYLPAGLADRMLAIILALFL